MSLEEETGYFFVIYWITVGWPGVRSGIGAYLMNSRKSIIF